MIETKLPTITEKAIGDTCSPFCGQFHYCEKWINEVLLAHEQHAKEMIEKCRDTEVGRYTPSKETPEYWRGRLEAIQSLRGTK